MAYGLMVSIVAVLGTHTAFEGSNLHKPNINIGHVSNMVTKTSGSVLQTGRNIITLRRKNNNN